jgi:hypothetical protein
VAGPLYKLNAFDPELETARFQPLNLIRGVHAPACDILVSKFVFHKWVNLYRYDKVFTGHWSSIFNLRTNPGGVKQDLVVGLFTLNQVDP